jgi:DNA-binding transcriptional regulator YhcF (GntR family)
MLTGQIDSTFTTQQRDLFASGFVAEIGVNAYGVWSAIKFHADFKTGEAYPGMRELGRIVGLSKDTVNRAVEILKKAHLLRVVANSKFKRKGQTYIARERLAIRVGQQVVCVVVIDYVPENIRKRINQIHNTLKSGEDDPDVWAEVEIIPGAGFLWDDKSKTLKLKVLASDMPGNGIEESNQDCTGTGEKSEAQ